MSLFRAWGGRRNRPERRRGAAGLVLALAAACAAPALADEAHPNNAVMSRGWTFAEQGGEALFAHVCAACHQPDAKGAIGAGAYPALAENGDLTSTELVLGALLDGLKGMPPVGRMMSDEQVADVVNYLRSHFGNAYAGVITAADVSAARQPKQSTP
jgi:mono/diheme cytochrome c family protein